ncbi:hypothetical protein WJX77_002932 [Trebouxia sp. C0004]
MHHSWLTFAALAVAVVHIVLHNAVAEAARAATSSFSAGATEAGAGLSAVNPRWLLQLQTPLLECPQGCSVQQEPGASLGVISLACVCNSAPPPSTPPSPPPLPSPLLPPSPSPPGPPPPRSPPIPEETRKPRSSSHPSEPTQTLGPVLSLPDGAPAPLQMPGASVRPGPIIPGSFLATQLTAMEDAEAPTPQR